MPTSFEPDSAGLVTMPSAHDVKETARRLEELLAKSGIHIFARIDHAAAAQQAGLSLRPTLVLVFGNPQVGTPLMQSNQTIGIDLPLKALIWEDEKGQSWLTYNDPDFLARRHNINDRPDAVKGMTDALELLARAATAK
jgi:uncharacterized protein (DUF302 family)